MDPVALLSLIVAIAALAVALSALRRSDKNTSAGTFVTLSDAFSRAWRRFIDASEPERDFEFAELANVFEIACAIHLEGSVHGASKRLLHDYLCNALKIIETNVDARERMTRLRETPTTFEHLDKFLTRMKK